MADKLSRLGYSHEHSCLPQQLLVYSLDHCPLITGAIEFGMFLESGQRLDVTYKAGEGVVVPQGTVHFARNAVCKKSEIVVIFDHPDPAVMYVGNALSQMPTSYLTSAFETDDFPQITGDQFFSKECKCGKGGKKKNKGLK